MTRKHTVNLICTAAPLSFLPFIFITLQQNYWPIAIGVVLAASAVLSVIRLGFVHVNTGGPGRRRKPVFSGTIAFGIAALLAVLFFYLLTLALEPLGLKDSVPTAFGADKLAGLILGIV